MKEGFEKIILKSTGANSLTQTEVVQSLWSGYGEIVRYALTGSKIKSVIVKDVRMPDQGGHPRGWNTDLSHERKVKSYQVETEWYRKYASVCDDSCRIPKCYDAEQFDDEVLLVLEDLDESGFAGRKSSVNREEINACLKWLANFHATFMQVKPEGLWESGTYWHLETRPEELEALDDLKLRNAAQQIDLKLKNATYQSIVHGDAKLANFCFSADGKEVAAVDFQYIGGGCGMKDVAYFIGSCLYEDDCERLETALLDFYFTELTKALQQKQPKLNALDIETEWRDLYPVAWTDFHRFIKGWSPGHWKIHSYSERLAREVVAKL